jgi:hypothetical protein
VALVVDTVPVELRTADTGGPTLVFTSKVDLLLPPVGAATPLGRREEGIDEMEEAVCVEVLEPDARVRD